MAKLVHDSRAHMILGCVVGRCNIAGRAYSMRHGSFTAVAVATLLISMAGQAPAQTDLDSALNSMNAEIGSAISGMANGALQQAIALENSGKLELAAGAYLDVMDLAGDDAQVPRAIAQVRLCGVRMKQARYAEARRICAAVLRMPDTPGNVQHVADEIMRMMDQHDMH